jgi:RHS repeat-associated protein
MHRDTGCVKRRSKLFAQASTTNFVWCGPEMCEERDGNNNVTKRFFSQGEQMGASSYYFLRDHLGSITEVLDSTPQIVARYQYDPFGRMTKLHGSFDSDFGFTGHYFHAPSGLNLTLYRGYAPDIGRWLSRDPVGEVQEVNLYSYVRNTPVNRLDPLGLADGPSTEDLEKKQLWNRQHNHENDIYGKGRSEQEFKEYLKDVARRNSTE